MQTYLAGDGKAYQVSDKFGPIDYTPDMDTSARVAVEARRRTLENIMRFLGGATPEEALGPGATLDQVHGQTWEPDTCGCKVSQVFDHYGGAQREIKPHRTHKHCQHHAHLNDHAAHHAELKAENSHKNRAVQAAAEAIGADPAEVSWEHNERRELVLRHAKLKSNHGQALAALARKTVIG
jgi:hypothetical protein